MQDGSTSNMGHTMVEGHVQLVEGQGALGGLAAVGVQLAVAAELHDVHSRLLALDHLAQSVSPASAPSSGRGSSASTDHRTGRTLDQDLSGKQSSRVQCKLLAA